MHLISVNRALHTDYQHHVSILWILVCFSNPGSRTEHSCDSIAGVGLRLNKGDGALRNRQRILQSCRIEELLVWLCEPLMCHVWGKVAHGP